MQPMRDLRRMLLPAGLATVALVVLLVNLRGATPDPPDELQFLEQISVALDALEGRCAEPRPELSRVVLQVQLRRLDRGEQGSALEILQALKAAVPAGEGLRPCTDVAEALFVDLR
jgi:hypothetical protein